MDNGKILAADENHSIVELIDAVLSRKNYKILKTNDGCSVIPAAMSEHPDLIILDMMLPHLEGFQMRLKLHKIQKQRIYCS